ncbi:MAG: RIO1 family regulatory kinase/ATPase [Candidatus Odinarchaeota archaeon]
MKEDHNQRLGFGFDKRRQGARSFDEHRRSRQAESKSHLKEIRIAEAKAQLLSTEKIDEVLGLLGGGKEATVLLARESQSSDYVCAKVFRYYTSTIRKRLRGTRHVTEEDMANLAARQEYWNLTEMYDAGIPVPKPRHLIGNIVVMDYISVDDNQVPAPLLREVDLTENHDPEDMLFEALDILADLFLNIQFIHGDYSEHNLMVTQNGLVTMDVSQSVQYNQKTFIETQVRIRIDRAVNLLETDIHNVNQYFQKRYRLSVDPVEIKEEIIQELPEHLQDFLTEKTYDIRPESMLSIQAYMAKQAYWNEGVKKISGRSKQSLKR